MSNSNKNILLVVYGFPPYPGVGGRRWAKIAKYLCRKGYNVHVLCAKSAYKEVSIFLNDVKELPNLHVHRLATLYPQIISQISTQKTLWDKVKYRIWLFILSIYSKGTIYDISLFWKNQLFQKMKELVDKHEIKNIIASGAPFRLLYYTAKFKQENPNLNFIADLRDPWTWGENYGMKSISSKRLQHEEFMQTTVMETANHVIMPVEDMRDYLKAHYPNFADKVKLISHAYDEDEIVVKTKTLSKQNKIRMVFYGSLYGNKISHYIDLLCSVFKQNKEAFTLDIFSGTTTHKDKFDSCGLSEQVQYHSALPPQQLFGKFSNYDVVLMVNPDHMKDFISTKFYEIIYTKTPIIYVAKEGMASRFVFDNKLGLAMQEDDLFVQMDNFLKGNLKIEYNTNFDIHQNSFNGVTDDLIELFL